MFTTHNLNPKNKQEEIISAEEGLVFDFQELLCKTMEKKSVSKDDLAELLDISFEEVTQLFEAEANPTLRDVAKIFRLLGGFVNLNCSQALIPDYKKYLGRTIKSTFNNEQPWACGKRIEAVLYNKKDHRLFAIFKDKDGNEDHYTPKRYPSHNWRFYPLNFDYKGTMLEILVDKIEKLE